jgi:hypothetical protein
LSALRSAGGPQSGVENLAAFAAYLLCRHPIKRGGKNLEPHDIQAVDFSKYVDYLANRKLTIAG